MPKLTILRGVSGSGKSTWARQQNAVIVSRDTLREAFYQSSDSNYYQSEDLREREEFITEVENGTIKAALKVGKDVIVDNTGVTWKYVKHHAEIGYALGADVELKVFDVRLEDAIRRDRQRAASGGRSVGETVIRKQQERFSKNKNMELTPPSKPRSYNGTPGKPKAFLVDIDGTLAHNNGKRGFFEWDRVGDDDPDDAVIAVVNSLADSGYEIIIMSGRDSVCRTETENWLSEHDVEWDDLFMRPEGDQRRDSIIKQELFDEHVRDHYDVVGVIDDRWSVISETWLAMGMKVFNVSGLDRGEF